MDKLPIPQTMKDFPYRDIEEKEKLSQYLDFKVANKTVEEIYRENEVKTTKTE